MIDKEHLGKRLLQLRRTKGLSQQTLADRLGVTAQAVSKWECGNAIPDVDILLALSHFYGLSINTLLGDESKEL